LLILAPLLCGSGRHAPVGVDADVMIHHKVELSVLRESNLTWWNEGADSPDEPQ
jgi:hypothetical protein